MIWLAFIATLGAQDPASAQDPEAEEVAAQAAAAEASATAPVEGVTPYVAFDLYQPPVVRPFEPADSFAASFPAITVLPHRPDLEAAVTVDSYFGAYERQLTDLEIAYRQGVSAAEARADALSGPLDGRWKVVDGAEQILFDLLLADDSRLISGAYRDLTVVGHPPLGLISAHRDGDQINLGLAGKDERWLNLRQGADGNWAGDFRYDDHVLAVRLVRGL